MDLLSEEFADGGGLGLGSGGADVGEDGAAGPHDRGGRDNLPHGAGDPLLRARGAGRGGAATAEELLGGAYGNK